MNNAIVFIGDNIKFNDDIYAEPERQYSVGDVRGVAETIDTSNDTSKFWFSNGKGFDGVNFNNNVDRFRGEHKITAIKKHENGQFIAICQPI